MTRSASLRRAALVLLLAASLVLAAGALARDADEVRSAVDDLSPGYVLAAAAAVLASLVLSLLTWRSALDALDVHLPLPVAARIFFVGQLGKYIPGSVWPVMAQMEMGAAHGLSRTAVGTASLLALAIGVPGALVIGLLAVPALLSGGDGRYLLVFAALPVAVLVLWPSVLNGLVAAGLRLLHRPVVPPRLDGRAIARTALLSGSANLLLGVHAALLALDLRAEGATVVPAAVGAFVLATVAGLLALPVPAGAGVREAVLVAALFPVLPLSAALVLAVTSRLLLTAADLAVAGAAAAGAARTPR